VAKVGVQRGRSGPRSGFTLLEILIAIVVLIVAVTAAFATQLSSLNLLHTARETNTAMADLENAMERALALTTDQIPVPGSAFQAGQPIAAFEGLHLDNERIVATYPGYAAGTVPDPLEIVFTMTWDDWMGRPRTMRLSTMKVR
jgi:type II secretory pathway pseudopilin PulG